MFGRILKYVVLLLIIVTVAIWFAENPGIVSVQWFGVVVDVPVALALVATVIVLGIVALSYRFWRYLRTSPTVFGHFRSERRLHNGYDALNKGFVAVAVGDAVEAGKYAKKAQKLLDDPTLTLLLSAQAAQLQGDDQAATRFFEQMVDRPNTAFLGLRGLYNQAQKAQEADKALDYAEQAFKLNSKAAWLVDALVPRYVAKKEWAQAQDVLETAVKKKIKRAEDVTPQRTVLITQRAKEALDAGEFDGAARLAEQAMKLDHAAYAPVLLMVAILQKQGNKRKLVSFCEKKSAQHPHPILAEAYVQAQDIEDPLKVFSSLEKIFGGAQATPQGRLILAQAALKAEMWGVAKDHLTYLCDHHPTVHAFELMADLMVQDHKDDKAAQGYLRKAAHAPRDAAWICGHCHNPSAKWQLDCEYCDTWGQIDWRGGDAVQSVTAL